MVVAVDGRDEPARSDGIVDCLHGKYQHEKNLMERIQRTVYTQIKTSPRSTAKNTQPVQVLVFRPLKKLAVKAAENAMVVENSYCDTCQPSSRPDTVT